MTELVYGVTWEDFVPTAPIVVLLAAALTAVLADAFTPRRKHDRPAPGDDSSPAAFVQVAPYITLGGVLAAALLVISLWSESRLAAQHSLALGPFSMLTSLVVLGATGLAGAWAAGYLPRSAVQTGEYHALLLCAACGGLTVCAANDLITLFLGVELLSLSVYALVGIDRGKLLGAEASMKYFILGAFSSGFLLYGMALIYGGSGGTIYLSELAEGRFATNLTLAGGGLLLIGMLFKVGAVPFHAWLPDAYDGAPAGVTGFMSAAVKAAGFAAMLRVLASFGRAAGLGDAAAAAPLATLGEIWPEIIYFVAALSIIIGNVAALTQTNPRRLLAYSAIAHTGYALIGVVAFGRLLKGMQGYAASSVDGSAADWIGSGDGATDALAAATFYLVTYAAMSLGAFAVLVSVARRGEDVESVDDLAGLGRRRPLAAAAMTLFMVSLIGLPPTAGFMGKLWLLQTAVDAGLIGLVVLALVATVVSVYYYLRMVVVMYMAPALDQPHAPGTTAPSWGQSLAIAAASAAVLLLGLLPSGAFAIAREGAESLLLRP